MWGDSVNVASRMESQGVPGKIQIGRATYDLIKDDFVCVAREAQEIKGKGLMETGFLERYGSMHHPASTRSASWFWL